MTLLKAPTAALTALVAGVAAGTLVSTGALAGGGGNAGGLRLVTVQSAPDRQPGEFAATNAAIAALINTGGRTIASPGAAWPSLLLEIPASWLPTLLGVSASQCPQTVLQLSTPELIVDAQGGWSTFLQSLGWTVATPTANGPWPVLNC